MQSIILMRNTIADLSKPEEILRVLKNIESPKLIVANGVTKYGEAGQLSSAEREIFLPTVHRRIDLIEHFLPNMKN